MRERHVSLAAHEPVFAVLAQPRIGNLRSRGLGRSPRFRLHGHHLPPGPWGRLLYGWRSTGPRSVTRSDPHTVDELYTRARSRSSVGRRGLCPPHRQRSVAPRRRLGVLLRRRPANPRPGRLQVRRRGTGRLDPGGTGRPPPHPRGAAADPFHAESRHLRSTRAGPPAVATACMSPAISRSPAAEHARFKQTDTDVASFDGGFGSALLARQAGQKIRSRDLLSRTDLQR